VDPYFGQLVVLRSRWNLQSNRIGVVVDHDEASENTLLVMWTTEDGVKMRYHLDDALLPVTEETIHKIKERV